LPLSVLSRLNSRVALWKMKPVEDLECELKTLTALYSATLQYMGCLTLCKDILLRISAGENNVTKASDFYLS
jgi:hypothetical protein